MVKDYFLALLDWSKVNVVLWDKSTRIVFNEGEIWWCSIGLNIGEEVFGKGANFMRPVLVFKKFTEDSFLGLPLTGSRKSGSWYIPIKLPARESSIMLNQARIIDKKRLQRRMVVLDSLDFQLVIKAFHEFYCS